MEKFSASKYYHDIYQDFINQGLSTIAAIMQLPGEHMCRCEMHFREFFDIFSVEQLLTGSS